MVPKNNKILNKIIVILSLFITLTLFMITPVVNASRLTVGDGEFYYTGTTKGTYVKSIGLWDWILKNLQQIADYLLGIMTMGVRMVFVGWTALLEKFLTWSLEATTGIPMDMGGVESSDLSSNSDSSNNVTVEAIVFNKVPMLDANLFEFKEKENAQCISGTGQYWVRCETCATDKSGLCKMDNCTCSECKEYIDNYIKKRGDDRGYDPNNNAVVIVKKTVATWYYVMRTIAIAGMLIVLLIIGVKLLITNIAQEKAAYKKMLIDWLVGFILLFTVHYIMIFIMDLNSTLINIVKDYRVELPGDDVREVMGLNKTDRENSEIEITVYDAVKTRAYDAKMINGTTGMVMYMTLLYLAFRFTLKYLKRFFSIIVLTLMAPFAAFAYAFCKALTGSATPYTNWFEEYLVTVLIQSVHAIIYKVFVSTALIISVDSVAGMLFAFIILNSMLGYEQIFRKIFKFTSKTGSDNASSAKGMIKNVRNAMGMMTGGKALFNSPVAKLAKMPAKALGTAAVMQIAKTRDRGINIGGKQLLKGREEREAQNLENFEKKNAKFEDFAKKVGMKDEDFGEGFLGVYETSEKNAIAEELQNRINEAAQKEDQDALAKALAQQQEFNNLMDETAISGWDVVKGHLDTLFDSNNYYIKTPAMKRYQKKYSKESEEYKEAERKEKEERQEEIQEQMKKNMGEERYNQLIANQEEREKEYQREFKKAAEKIDLKRKRKNTKYTSINGVFGKIKLNRQAGKIDVMKPSDLVREQLKVSKLLGFTDADKKVFAENAWKPFKQGLIGIGSLYLGFATVVSEPKAGFALLATGTSSYMDAFGPNGRQLSEPKIPVRSQRFKFNGPIAQTKKRLSKVVRNMAISEKNRMVVNNVRKKHPKLFKGLTFGAAGAGLLVKGVTLPGRAFYKVASSVATPITVTESVRSSNLKANLNRRRTNINEHHLRQLNKLIKSFEQDEVETLAVEMEDKFSDSYKKAKETIKSDIGLLSMQELEEKRAIDNGEAVKQNGNVVYVREEVGIDNEQKLIEQSILEVAISKKIKDLTKLDLNNSGNRNEVKKVIEQKLASQGVIEKGQKIENIIEQIDSKIDKTKKSLDKNHKSFESNNEATQTDELLFQEVVKEYIEETGESDISRFDPEELQKRFHTKKEETYHQKGTKEVENALKKKKAEELAGQERNSNQTENNTSTDDNYSQEEKEKDHKMVTSQLSKMIELNKNKKSRMKKMQEILNMDLEEDNSTSNHNEQKSKKKTKEKSSTKENKKQENNNNSDSNEQKTEDVLTKFNELKRREMLKRVNEMENLFVNAMEVGSERVIDEISSGNTENSDSSNLTISDTQSVLDALFYIKELRALNVRGDNLGIRPSVLQYRKQNRRKLQMEMKSQGDGKIPNGDRVYSNSDGSRRVDKDSNLNKEVYGSVSDIIDLINSSDNT